MSMATLLDEGHALELDAGDALAALRQRFHIPPYLDGEAAYLAGNSLGLQPRATRELILGDLDNWAHLGVEGHGGDNRAWVTYHELLREPSARLVGARPDEVVAMNSLTVNLHLLMISFYRPTAPRNAIVIEDSAFPSDSYAVRSQAAFHGYDPDEAIIRLRPRDGEHTLRTEDVIKVLTEQADRIALVMLGAVNYYTGEYLDIPAITAAGHAAGVIVGWDLAHAAGNVPLDMHEWDVDWAAWCSYKYLNSGPGSLAGAFVHERHLHDVSLPKFAGWWGNDLSNRFLMGPTLTPVATADSWQLSNPPILAAAPVLASLRLFDEVGMDALRVKSVRLTGYLESLLDVVAQRHPITVITPRDPARRGAQLSVQIPDIDVVAVSDELRTHHGVYADSRQPDVIRYAPAPMYCSFHDCWRAATALSNVLDAHGR